jgi:hypothetical protein
MKQLFSVLLTHVIHSSFDSPFTHNPMTCYMLFPPHFASLVTVHHRHLNLSFKFSVQQDVQVKSSSYTCFALLLTKLECLPAIRIPNFIVKSIQNDFIVMHCVNINSSSNSCYMFWAFFENQLLVPSACLQGRRLAAKLWDLNILVTVRFCENRNADIASCS